MRIISDVRVFNISTPGGGSGTEIRYKLNGQDALARTWQILGVTEARMWLINLGQRKTFP